MAHPSPKEHHLSDHPLIQNFLKAYPPVIERVRAAIKMTSTEAWDRLYTTHRKSASALQRELADELREGAACLERGHSGEDNEKAIKDTLKRAVALREAEAHWVRQTVEPVRRAVDDAKEMVASLLSGAAIMQAREPLTSTGLVAEAQRAAESLPAAGWCPESGQASLTILDVSTGEILPA